MAHLRPYPSTVADFLALLDGVPWFVHVGKPHPRDPVVRRIRSWEEWRGDEWDAVGIYSQFWRDRLEVEARRMGREEEATQAFASVRDHVLDLASLRLRGELPECLDPVRAKDSAVLFASWWSAIVAGHVASGLPVPEPLVDLWRWYAEGHWPCGFPYSRQDAWRPPALNWRPEDEPWRDMPTLTVF